MTPELIYGIAVGEMCPVEGIRLRKSGEHTVVDAEIGGEWIEIIRERSDGEFCHIVEASGMFECYYDFGMSKRHLGYEETDGDV